MSDNVDIEIQFGLAEQVVHRVNQIA
jgi:hypothetical protein